MPRKTVTTDDVRERLFGVMERAGEGDLPAADARSIVSAAKTMTELLIAERKQAELAIKLNKKPSDIGKLVVARRG